MKTLSKLKISLLILVCNWLAYDLYGQATISNSPISHDRVAGYYLGWNASGTAGTLEIRNDFTGTPYTIEFWLNSVARIEMQQDGDLNVLTGTQGYQIDGNYVLRHNNITSNIYVGVGAGDNTTGTNNSFTGNLAGNINSSGTDNTFNGFNSGSNNDYANFNTFMGSYSGFSNNSDNNTFIGYISGAGNATGVENVFLGANSGAFSNADNNTFLGFESGFNNTDGANNTFVGHKSGLNNSSGAENTFIGKSAGEGNTTGEQNSIMGFEAGLLSNGNDNIFIGFQSGRSNVSGNANTIIGTKSGYANIASNNTYVGHYAGVANTTGASGTFVGKDAGMYNTTGQSNSFFGHAAGLHNTTGTRNTYCGFQAGNSNSTGDDNSYFGNETGLGGAGSRNTAMGSKSAYWGNGTTDNALYGYRSGYYISVGSKNTIMGSESGSNLDIGNENTFIGYQSGNNNSSGNNNTFIGKDAGLYNSTGNFNTYVGDNAGQISTGSHALVYSAAIGADAKVLNDYQMILGDNNINVGIGLSNDASGPRDKLEIKSGTTGVSGLQFTNLTSSYNPGVTAPKFLTVDVDGKVVLRDAVGGGGSTNACSSVSTSGDIGFVPVWSAVTPSKEICKSQIYDDGTSVGIGFGSTLPTGSTYELAVNGNFRLGALSDAFYLNSERFLCSEGGSYASSVYLGIDAGPTGANTCAGDNNICIGVESGRDLGGGANIHESNNIFIGRQSGSNVQATAASEGHGNTFLGLESGEGFTIGNNNVCIGTQTGTNYTTQQGNVLIGDQAGHSGVGRSNVLVGQFADIPFSTTVDYSCALGYSSVVEATNSVAIGANSRCISPDAISLGDCSTSNVRTLMGYTTVPATGGSPAPPSTGFRLYVNSISNNNAAYFNGLVYENGAYVTSDSTLKSNIQSLNSQFVDQVIDQLAPKTYTFDVANNPSLNLESGQQFGLLAQEVEAILPGLVTEVTAPALTDNQGNVTIAEKTFKALNYTGLIPFLISKIKDQDTRLDQLEQQLNNCCNSNPNQRSSNPAIDVVLSNSIILNQNDPNPFAEETKITFNIPTSVADAKIIFTDNAGHIIQTVKINERGAGQLNVYGSDLTSGIYSYSLIVDGRVIDSKKMVLTR